MKGQNSHIERQVGVQVYKDLDEGCVLGGTSWRDLGTVVSC